MVTLEILLDVAQAEKKANEFQQTLVKEFKEAATKGEAGFKDFANKTDKELAQLAEKAKTKAKEIAEENKKKAEESKKFWVGFANDAIGVFGDLKDAWQMSAQGLLGLDKATVDLVSHVGDLSEKGAQIGNTFGPGGALVGFFAGALAGAIEQIRKLRNESPAAAAKMNVLLTGTEQSKQGFLDAGVAGQGFRIALEKVQEGAKKLDGGLGDLAPILRGFDGFFNLIGHSAIYSKEKVQEFADALHDTLSGTDEETLKTILAPLAADIKDKNDAAAKAEAASQKRIERINKEIQAEEQLFASGQQRLEPIFKDLNDGLDLEGMREEFLQGAEGFQTFQEEADPNRLKQITDEIERMQKALDLKKAVEEIKQMSEHVESIEEIVARVKAQNQAKFFQTLSDEIKAFGDTVASALGDQAAGAAERYFNAIASGEARSAEARKKARLEFLKNLGIQLVGEGVSNEFKGGTKILEGNIPGGLAQIAFGTAEIAAGVGLGAGASRSMRKHGFGADSSTSSSGSLGRNNNQSNGPIVQTPTTVVVNSLLPHDKRSWELLSSTIHKAHSMAS